MAASNNAGQPGGCSLAETPDNSFENKQKQFHLHPFDQAGKPLQARAKFCFTGSKTRNGNSQRIMGSLNEFKIAHRHVEPRDGSAEPRLGQLEEIT